LSCGKDNRTICWNTQSGEAFGEFPIVTNWTFQTRWNPHFPSILATASFDGKITVQTIQNTKPASGQASGAQAQVLDGEDFFNSAQTEPLTAAFSLPKAPRWLERPTGVAFGFGGKIVSFSPAEASPGAPPRRSKVRISHFAVEGGIGNATEAFEKSLAEGDVNGICQSHIANARTEEEKADWQLMQSLIADNPRRKLVEFLGFSDNAEGSADVPPKATADDDGSQNLAPSDAEEAQPDGSKSASARKNRLSSFFEGTEDGDSFLSDLSATKGAKTNNPFHIYTGSESTPDKQITQALILGQFEKAMEICLREGRMSDAFVVAICGGQQCIEKAQAAYFAKKTQGPNYTRLLASVIGKNLWDVVYNADLSNWKEVMATVCTYANEDEFPDLCEGLGDRLEDELKAGGDKTELRKSASFCYLAGSKLDKVVTIWIEETQEDETAGLQQGEADSTFSLHARSLQNLMEKVAVFRKVTHFEDKERDRRSDWKLAALYDKYTEYADMLAAHGFLEVAERYLDLLPPQYAAAEVARNRVKQATRKSAPQPQVKQSALPGRPAPKTQMNQPSAAARYGAPNTYAQNTPAVPAAQPGAATPNVYAPPGFQQPQQLYNAGGAAQLGVAYARPGPGAPPRNVNASPAVPPPPRASEQNWNDTPMVTKLIPARRGTPAGGVPPAPTPFINQPQQYPYQAPPPSAPFTPQQRATPPLPPPPKGPAPPPRMTSPPTMGPPGHSQMPPPERPASATRNPYAPAPYSQPAAAIPPPPTVPRGPSPYNPPPAGAPPTSRYAPAAPAQGVAPPDLQGRHQPPPPPQQPAGAPRPGPPMQGYAPTQPMLGAQAPGRATPYGGAPPTQQGPPQAAGPPPPASPSPNLGAPPQARAQTPNAGPTRYRKSTATPFARLYSRTPAKK
jgi:protein transport protein SEC31